MKLLQTLFQYGTVYVPAVLELDLQDVDSVPAKAADALEIYGCIDILVNNAGVSFRGTVLETSIEVDQKIMNTNYMGPLALTKGEASIPTKRSTVICNALLYENILNF